MKKQLKNWLVLAILCNGLFAMAQSPTVQISKNMTLEQLQKHFAQCSHNSVNATAKITSKEEMAVTGSFSFTLTVKATDTMYIDDLIIGSNTFLNIFTGSSASVAAPPISSVFGSTYLLPGQITTATVNVTHPTTNLPYYPTGFDLQVKTHKYNETENKISPVTVKVYFTPYNSVEIWDLHDFIKLPRVWALPSATPPARVSIARTSVPTSTRPNPSQITAAWQKNFQVTRVAGLPYLIQMAAVHPDTIKYYRNKDSIEVYNGQHSGTLNKGLFGNTFDGTITGKMVANYINDNGTPVTIGLEGVKIAAYDEDIIYDEELSKTHTGADGSFNLSYSNWESWAEGSQIELFIQWWSENDNYDLDVIQNGFFNSTFNISFSNHLWIGDVGTSYTNNMGNMFIGLEHNSDKDPYKILNWATKAYKFTREQINSAGAADGLNIFAYDDDNITGGTSYCYPVNWTGIHPYISLVSSDMNHESTIWHEFGHFAMYNLQGNRYLYCSTDKHQLNRPSNTELSWTEGWATGFMNMLDIYYRYTDQESGFEKAFETQAVDRRIPNELRRPNIYGNTNLNGFRSEYFISSFINDLFDGPTNFVNVSTITTSDYNDVSLNGDGYILGENDDLQLSAFQVCRPLFLYLSQNAFPQSIYDYYLVLMSTLDCNDKKKLKKIAFQNGIKPDHTDNNSILSSDLIGTPHQTVTYTCPVTGNNTRVELNSLQDLNSLTTLNQSYNFGQYLGNELNDNLDISSSTLGVNSSNPQRFYNSGIPNPTTNPTVSLYACNIVNVNNSGKIIIGSGTNQGNYIVKGGAKMVLNSLSSLEVFDNSNVIIENGGILIFNKGASIKLSGPNSKIIVKAGGKIQIGKDAIFNYTGNGFIRFETAYPTSAAIEAIGTNAQFKLVGGSFGTTTKKVMEVVGGQMLSTVPTYGANAGLYDLRLFSIQNGNVVMDANSCIQVEGTYTQADFRSLDVRAAVPNSVSNRHRGIVVNGQLGNSFYKFTVTDAIMGINSRNIYGGNDVDLIQVTASRCETGIYVNGAGARIQDHAINNCTTGIKLVGMTRSTRLYNGDVFYNTIGVEGSDCINNVIELYQPKIYNNFYGVKAINTTFASLCGLIKNNLSSVPNNAGKYDGANVYLVNNGNFILDPIMRAGAGRTDLGNNRSVAFRQASASYGPYINQAGSSLLTDLDYSITGTLAKLTNPIRFYPNVQANGNLWGYTSGISRSPIALIDYNTQYFNSTSSTPNSLSYIDNIPLAVSFKCNASAGGGGAGTDRMRGFINGTVTPIADLNDKMLQDGSMLKAKVQEGYNYFYDLSPNYDLAIRDLLDALNADFTPEELPEWSIAITEINAQLIEALSEGIYEQNMPIKDDLNNYSELVQRTIDLQDKLLNDFANDNQLQFKVYMAKAALYRMLGNLDMSNQILNAVDRNLYPEMNDALESFNCLVNKELLLVSGAVTPQDYESLPPCPTTEDLSVLPPPFMDNPEDLEKILNGDDQKTSNLKFALSVYPNPSKGLFNLSFNGQEASNYTIEVIDILGKKVYASAGIVLLNNNIEINLANLNTGTYFVKVVNGSNAETQKVMIVK